MSASVTYIYRGSLFDDGFSRKDGNQRVSLLKFISESPRERERRQDVLLVWKKPIFDDRRR